MALVMVYGMVVYNVALNTGTVSGETFLLAIRDPNGCLLAVILLRAAGAFNIPHNF
ncbi:hypothetical protein [Faecalicatena contorta]|uniref:hypothetical protein n=1 Tax=Faecalicatena contorta TaxID=39482 RepID=UPI002ED05940